MRNQGLYDRGPNQFIVTSRDVLLKGSSLGVVFRSTNSGETWDSVSNGLVGDIGCLDEGPDGRIFAASGGRGIYMSTDEGLSWQMLRTDGLFNRYFISLAVDDDGYVYVGTAGAGVFRSTHPVVTGMPANKNGNDAGYELHQNYPNPFNSSTMITYQLSMNAKARITICNLLGQEVRTLMNARQKAGQHKVVWDGRDNSGRTVASGVYLYRLEVGRQVKTRKLVLLK